LGLKTENMKKLIIIALVVISAVAGAATLNKVNKEEVKTNVMPAQEIVHTNSSAVATWD
jgi:hypothetical protein